MSEIVLIKKKLNNYLIRITLRGKQLLMQLIDIVINANFNFFAQLKGRPSHCHLQRYKPQTWI